MNNYYYIKEYLPKRYTADIQQEEDREECYAFKDGILSESVKNSFLGKIKEITSGKTNGWVICFIPASTALNTKVRFSKLADAIRNAGYEVERDAIFNKYDTESGHIAGKTGNPIESFGFDGVKVSGKKVILIDDIITRGTTFNMASSKLMELGAISVIGLFLAKTINPDYHQNYVDDSYYDEPDYDPYEEEERTYERYNGSYAQDVEGWSDQDIDDVFDGDPDAYWNID